MMNDTVLVLPTSGTTGTPKLVPLTQTNIQASIEAWVRAFSLTSTDRCLNVMPLWHGGLISNVLASHSVGATVINVPKPSLEEFWELIKQYAPTWLPLPVGLAEQILGDERIFHPPHLRFVRLSKASLTPNQLHDLGCIFKCPVLQSYGMTEASSGPVTTETLDHRCPGSVGKPIHLEIKIDRDQILIRGPSVMQGYVAGPSDIFAFTWDSQGGKWLQTGDLGHLDDNGFLYLTGRI